MSQTFENSIKDDPMNEVALVESINNSSIYFIENASNNTIFISFLIICIVYFLLFVSTYGSFNSCIKEYESYPVNLSEIDDFQQSADIDLNYSRLTKNHKFITVKLALRKTEKSKLHNFPLSLTTNSVFMLNDKITYKPSQSTHKFNTSFQKSGCTPYFTLFSSQITDADSYLCHLGIEAPFIEISDYLFEVSYSNPNYLSFNRSIKPLISIISLYFLCIFLIYTYYIHNFTTTFIIILGICGIFYFNPFKFFGIDLMLLDQLIIHIFLSLFHIFCLSQLHLIKIHSITPRSSFLIFAFVISCTIGITDGITDFERSKQLLGYEMPILSMEYGRLLLHCIYICVLITISIIILRGSTNQEENRRFIFIATFSIGTSIFTFLFDFLAMFCEKYRSSILDTVVYQSLEAVTATFMIFFFHGYFERHYKSVEPNVVDNDIMIDDDQATSVLDDNQNE